jgi:hypothetical protein
MYGPIFVGLLKSLVQFWSIYSEGVQTAVATAVVLFVWKSRIVLICPISLNAIKYYKDTLKL